jgi:hypothetical protein
VQFTNLTDGQVLRYSMVLVDGTFDGGAALTITAAPATAGVSFTKHGSRFRCLVDLKPGTNTLTITDSHGPVALNLVFTPPTATDHRFKIWYVVPSDEANSPVDPDYATHFSLQAKLMQSWMAEDQLRAGHGRLTFYPELDATGNVSVGKLVVSQTRAQATALNAAMYGEVWNQLPAAYKDGRHKNLVFSSVAFNALGSGDLCYVGAYTNFHPGNATEMMSKLLSTQLGNDNALTYATYNGVTLHEMIHCLHSIWHDTSDYNIMGGGGYDISQYFTLTYSASNPAPHSESSAGTLGNQRDLAAWNRYLMSADPHVYQNTTVGINAGPEYLTATSAYPLAVFHYYVPAAAANLHTLLAASNVTTYRKHAGQARLDLGSHPFNVMAVDTEGNMSYATFSGPVPVVPVADSYSVSAGALVVAAPGVLGNDINPSASTLTAAVATNVQHGTLALNANGGFSYTPTAGYTGTDTFTYTASDGVSSDQQALVILTVTAPLLPPPTNPVPASGATAVAVSSALDWTDSVGATGYQVYLWPSAQTKPATPTAIVTVSNYVPPANLIAATQYSWQVVATWQTDSSAGATWSFATAAQTATPTLLISVDFVYSGLGGANGGVSAACSGDTTLTGTTLKNAIGNVFTGQTGIWNAIAVGGNNANNSSAITGFLTNSGGTATTVKFAMGTATGLGSSAAGNWRNNYLAGWVGGGGAMLRSESAYLYYPTLTVDHYAWSLTGLTPNANYRLTLFGSGSNTFTNIANTVAGVPDAEGDWNWSSIQASAAGVVSGTLLTTGNNQTFGLYGLQVESIGSAYATWADTYAGGGMAGEDYNNDGVQNGIAYFMGMNGLATHPGVAGGTVTWPRDPAATITSFRVQVSDNLAAWTDIVPPHASIDTSVPARVTYTLPTGAARKFCRLVVVP